MLVDSHCHLDQLARSEEALREAAQAGVGRIAAVSESAASMAAVLILKERWPDLVLAGLGLHPAWVVQQEEAAIDEALAFLAEHLPQADLLGEVGLDFKWAPSEGEQRKQESVLERQFELAAACHKPINLHSRRSQRQVMERAISFKRATGLNAQLHWFTQSKKLVRVCNSEGVFVSVGPTVLGDAQTQEVAAEIDDDLLLLETDSPVPINGVPGHPARVRAVAEKLAELKGEDWQEVAQRTSANFSRYMAGPQSLDSGISPG